MPQGWYGQVSGNLGKIADCITFYESQLEEARVECGLVGNIEKNATRIPGIVEHRFNQLQEIEAILEFLNIQLRKVRSKFYKRYLENYQRALTSNDVKNYIDGEQEVVDMANVVNEFALLRNKYLGLMKAIDAKQFQINNIVKLRVAGLDDAELFAKK
jgi:hypothetical protein|tara:strand:+ start:1819 stop:2292 length:474 start_codon:yes stop_codon:yes gene_type:complete